MLGTATPQANLPKSVTSLSPSAAPPQMNAQSSNTSVPRVNIPGIGQAVNDRLNSIGQLFAGESDPYARWSSQQRAINATDFWSQAAAPRAQTLQNTLTDIYLRRIPAMQGNYNLQEDQLRRGFDLDNQQLDSRGRVLDIERAAAGRQPQYLDDLRATADARYRGDLAYVDQLRGFNTRDRDLSMSAANLSRDKALFDTADAAAAAGATTSAGYAFDRDAIARQFGIDKGRADLSFDTTGAGLDDRGRNLNLDFWQSGVEHNESKARARDRIRTLDEQARSLGVDREQLRNSLDKGLTQLGMSRQVDVDRLLDMFTSTNLQQQMLAEEIMRNALNTASQFSGQQTFAQAINNAGRDLNL